MHAWSCACSSYIYMTVSLCLWWPIRAPLICNTSSLILMTLILWKQLCGEHWGSIRGSSVDSGALHADTGTGPPARLGLQPWSVCACVCVVCVCRTTDVSPCIPPGSDYLPASFLSHHLLLLCRELLSVSRAKMSHQWTVMNSLMRCGHIHVCCVLYMKVTSLVPFTVPRWWCSPWTVPSVSVSMWDKDEECWYLLTVSSVCQCAIMHV